MSDSDYRVSVIDDDPDVAQYTRTILERRAGCTVQTASTALEARVAIDAFQPDVVITDIEMPGMTGLELLAELRRDRPDLPVIVMTAHVSVDYAVGALRGQADEFITKPIDSPHLIATVLRLAAEGRMRSEASRQREFVLAIGAHPDDVELGVGGILASHRAAGDLVAILTLSNGGKGGAGEDRRNESRAAAELLGARLYLEDLPDTEIMSTGPTVKIIESVIREVNPTIVYTHSAHDRHQDHRATHEAVVVAARTVDTIACFQSPSSTVDFRPTRFVSIDGFTDAKLALLACFQSQSEIRDYLDADFVLATARYWSRFGGGTSVEPLEVLRETADMSMQVRRRAVRADLSGGRP